MQKNRFGLLIIVLLAGFLLRLILADSLKHFTVYTDLLSFQAWSLQLATEGFKTFYTSVWSDYLPGYLYVLWLMGYIFNFLSTHSLNIPVEIFYKLPSMIADCLNALFLYLIALKFTSPKKAIIAAAIFLANPAIFANSTLWGQADSFMALFLLSSFYYLLEGRLWLSALLLGIGQTVKPIAVLALPIFLIYIILRKSFKYSGAIFLAIFTLTVIISFIPFNNTGNLLQFIVDRHLVTSNQYPYTSVNAINFWSIVTSLWKSDQIFYAFLTLQQWGYLLFIILYGFLLTITCFRLRENRNNALFSSFVLAICYFGMYLFLTRMHERHLFFGLSFISLVIPILSPLSAVIVSGSFLIYLVNLYYAYSQIKKDPLILDSNIIFFLSLSILVIFFYLLIIFIRKYVKSN